MTDNVLLAQLTQVDRSHYEGGQYKLPFETFADLVDMARRFRRVQARLVEMDYELSSTTKHLALARAHLLNLAE